MVLLLPLALSEHLAQLLYVLIDSSITLFSFLGSASRTAQPQCTADLNPFPPMFLCNDGLNMIGYSSVCNFYKECNDNSDESFCENPKCKDLEYHCGQGQVKMIKD